MTDKYRSDSPVPYLSDEGELARQKWVKHFRTHKDCGRFGACAEETALFDNYMKLRRRDRDNQIT